MSYNPVTPLSCDCGKTLMKSCALAYHPVAGCAIATVDLGTCVSVSHYVNVSVLIMFSHKTSVFTLSIVSSP